MGGIKLGKTKLGKIINNYLKLAKLKGTEKVSYVMASISMVLIFSLIFLLALFFLGFGVSFLIGYFLDHTFFGFLIVSGFFFIVALIIWLFRGIVKKNLVNFFIKLMYK